MQPQSRFQSVFSNAALTFLVGLTATTLIACGSGDNNEENNAGNNGTGNNTTGNNTTGNNTTGNNTTGNNTTGNNTTGNNTTGNNTTGNNTTGNNTTGNNTTGNNNPTGTARVQVLHLAEGAGTVDVYNNDGDAPLIDDLDERAGTAFFEVPSGVSLSLDVVAGDAADSSEPVYTLDLPNGVPADSTYILAATGDVTADDGADDAFRIVAIPGARSSGEPDVVKVLVVHGVDDAPEVDVVLDNGDRDDPAISELPFAEFTADDDGNAEYVDLDPTMTLFGGPLMIDINVADVNDHVASFQTPDLSGFAGQAITIAATGSVEDGTFGLTAFLALEAGAPSPMAGAPLEEAGRLQVIHNSPDPAAAIVDVYVGTDLLLLNDFAFRGATPYLTVPAGEDNEFDVNITGSEAADASDPVAGPIPVELDNGSTTIAVASGIVGDADTPFALLTTEGREANATEMAVDTKIHHGSPDAQPVGVRPAGTEVALVPMASYEDFTDYLPVPSATVGKLELFDPDTDATLLVTEAEIDFSGFSSPVIVLASGFLTPGDVGADAEAIGLLAIDGNGDTVVVPLVAPTE